MEMERKRVVDVEYGGAQLRVEGLECPPFVGGFYEPPESRSFEIEEVSLDGLDVTEEFDSAALEEIAGLVLEALDDRREAAADEWYDRMKEEGRL